MLPATCRRRFLEEPELWGRVLLDLDSDVAPYFEVLRDSASGVLDHGSWRRPRWANTTGASYSLDEMRTISARLLAAGRALPAMCKEANDLLVRFARVVVIRRDGAAPDQWMSETTEGFLGRIELNNPHLSQVGPLEFVEALVHETIHSYVSTVELFHPLVPDREAANEITVQSPWTGASLDAQRFVHATLVWWGLLHFWSRCLRGPAAEVPALRNRWAACRLGFEGRGLRHALAGLAPTLSLPARALLERIALASPPG